LFAAGQANRYIFFPRKVQRKKKDAAHVLNAIPWLIYVIGKN
jgi:hypothetical protein